MSREKPITLQAFDNVGTYTYSGKGPHAVTSISNITSNSHTGTYTYDNNGNQTGGAGRSITYSTYDQPTRIVSSGATTDFKYGPDRARFERKDVKNGKTIYTHYLGNVERIQESGSAIVEWKRYINGAVYTVRTNNGTVEKTHKSFMFNDHLGSLDVVTDAVGKITHSTSFDAWGARRSGENWANAFSASSISLTGFNHPLTQRGYTGHEMLDDHNLIHMNGRIYDAKLARFLQADPFIQAATDTQSYNRYSYVMNNPLNTSDPSGFFFSKLWKELKPFVGALTAIAVTFFCSICGPVVSGIIGGAVGAAVNDGNILLGAVFGAFTGLVGGIDGFSGFVARGAIGGMQSVMADGRYGNGFFAAGIGGLGGGSGYSLSGFIQSAVLGGVASEITGGKFKNGAASAAFMYAVSAGVTKLGPDGDEVEPTEVEGSPKNKTRRTGRAVIDVKDGSVSVTSKIYFEGDVENLDNLASSFIDGVEKEWSGEFGDNKTLTTNIERVESARKADLVVKFLPDSANKAGWRSYTRIGGKTIYMNISDSRLSWTAAHEFGHSLGFDDAYSDVKVNGKTVSVPYVGYRGNIMSTGNGKVWSSDIDYLIRQKN